MPKHPTQDVTPKPSPPTGGAPSLEAAAAYNPPSLEAAAAYSAPEGTETGALETGLGDPEQPEPNVSKSEQKSYDEFVNKAMELIYEPKMLEVILRGLGREDGLAQTTIDVVTKVESSADTAGVTIDPEVVFNGGIEILEQLVELGEAAGIKTYSPQDIEKATLQAMDLYRERGPQSEERTMASREDFAQMVEDSQSGKLEKDFPELAERATAMAAAAPTGAPAPPGPGAPTGAPAPTGLGLGSPTQITGNTQRNG